MKNLKYLLICFIGALCIALCPIHADAQSVVIRERSKNTTPVEKPKTQSTPKASNKSNKRTKTKPTQSIPKTVSEPDTPVVEEQDDDVFVFDGEQFVFSADSLEYNPNKSAILYGQNIYKFEPVKYGTFTMGTPSLEAIETIETPSHRVELFGFKMGATEVPQWLWEAVMDYNPSSNQGLSLPVESVSYDECMLFIAKLNELTGKCFDLPTEAQWEFAARECLDENPNIYSGSNNIDDVAWHAGNSQAETHEVGLKTPNSINLFDMSGNVCEWCHDWYSPYTTKRATNPKGPDSGIKRVYRSGSYISSPSDCRNAKRYAEAPNYKAPFIGFRLVLSSK